MPLIPERPATNFRWTICALIFFAMTVNYLDRFTFSSLVPFFEDDLKLGPTDLALINVGFVMSYGSAMMFVGQFIDRVGIKRGLATTFLVWNVASICHAFVTGLGSFIGIRCLLGISESGMYPGAVKTVSDWFPAKERSLANGIFNGGSNVGAILAPILGVELAVRFGWRMCFVITGSIGMIWILFWKLYYKPLVQHPKVSKSEIAYIRAGQEEESGERLTYSQLFGMRPVYGLALAKAVTDAPLWFLLLWLPKVLVDQFHVTPRFYQYALPIVYIVADGGAVFGGWISSVLLRRGKSLNYSRKSVMLVSAILVVPIAFVGYLVDRPELLGISCVYWSVGIIAVAVGAHQAWSTNLFTVISDTVPRSSMAMAVGAINGFAMVGVAAMQFFVGWAVQTTSSYTIPFIVCGFLYLVGFVILQIFVPTVEPCPTHRRAKMPAVAAGVIAILLALIYMQYVTNKPPYSSLAEYVQVRQTQLHAVAAPQPDGDATVGWMQARWYLWRLPDGKTKRELVKLDTHGHPFIEAKGAKAAKYHAD